tara:strand:+ start:1163 stop:1642 length:480 start_codon:yes stop_codon:yes gene_type:complete
MKEEKKKVSVVIQDIHAYDTMVFQMVVDYLNNKNLIDILTDANSDSPYDMTSHFKMKIAGLPKTQMGCPCPFTMFTMLESDLRHKIVLAAKEKYLEKYLASRKIEVVNLDKVEAKAQDFIRLKNEYESGADSAYLSARDAESDLASQVLEDLFGVKENE